MVIKYRPGRLNPANSLFCHSDSEKEDELAILAGTLRDTTESVSWLSRRHPGEPVGQKWSRMQIIVPSHSTSDRAILTHFSMPVDLGQDEVSGNMSGSGGAFLQVLIQNAHFSTAQKQKSFVFSASTEEALFGQRLRKAHQKKKTLINDFSSADTPTKESQRPNSGLWQFYFKKPEDLRPLMSRNNIKQIAKEETAYSKSFIELRTVFQVLQEVDPLLQRKQLHLAKTRLVEQSINRAPAGVLATIVEEMTDLTSDPP